MRTDHAQSAIDIYADSKIAGEALVRQSSLKTVALRIAGIAVPAFLEPPEYLAPRRWRQQFESSELSDDLRLHRGIRPIAGATLTAQAATDAVRRVLAIDRVLEGEPAEDQP